MFKFIHCADLHLDSPLRGLTEKPDAPVEEIRQASRRALGNLVNLAWKKMCNSYSSRAMYTMVIGKIIPPVYFLMRK